MNIKSSLFATTLCLPLLLNGCASTTAGHVEKEQAQSIQNGVTTKRQLIERLGEPNENSNQPNGIEKLTWQGTRNSLDAKTFIPFYGIVAGSGSTESSQLVVWVNKAGIVTNYQYEKQTVTEDTFGNKSTKKTNLSGSAQTQNQGNITTEVDKNGGTAPSTKHLGVTKNSNDLTAVLGNFNKGCDVPTAEGRALMKWLATLHEGKMSSRPDMGSVLNSAIGTPNIHQEKDFWMADFPISGTYHGLTVTNIKQWAMKDSGMTGFTMVFKEPMTSVKKRLAKIKFSADEAGDKAELTMTATKPPRAALICDSQ